MFEFNTVEEAVKDLKDGKISQLQMMMTERMRATLYVRQNMPQQKMSTLWRPTEEVLYVCL